MARTFAALKALVHSKLSQESLSISESNLTAACNLALDTLALRLDLKETAKISALTPIFNDVLSYACPTDLKGDSIHAIRPYPSGDKKEDLGLNRLTTNRFDANYFWYDADGLFAIEHNLGTRTLRINKNPIGAVNQLLHNCEAYNTNGTWVADTTNSDALNVATDTGSFTQGSASVSFDIDVSQSANDYALVYNSTLTALNLSTLKPSISYAFIDVYLPTASITSIELRWGTDASNYYSRSATANFDGTSFKVGWNTIGVAWEGATETGTVTDTSIGYIAVKLNYAASLTDQTGVKIDNFYMRQGGLYEILYYSIYAVLSTAGANKQYFTADDDTLVCDAEGEAVYVDYVAGEIAPNTQTVTGQTYAQRSEAAIMRYNSRNPSMRKVVVNTYA